MSRVTIASALTVVPLAFLVSLTGMAQEEILSARLDIALSKQKYSIGEAVVVTYRITNLSDSLICFPPPAVDCYSIDGELAPDATPPKGVSRPNVGRGCAADRLIDQDADFDIDQHWIKLGPLQSYEITQESHSIGLTSPGEWLVEAGYVPMRENAQSLYQPALKERGCSLLPELHSPKAKLSVSGKVQKHLTGVSRTRR